MIVQVFLYKELGLKMAYFLDLNFNSTTQCILNKNPKLSKLIFIRLVTVNYDTRMQRTACHYLHSFKTAITMI